MLLFSSFCLFSVLVGIVKGDIFTAVSKDDVAMIQAAIEKSQSQLNHRGVGGIL
jgi:hypothetical protein